MRIRALVGDMCEIVGPDATIEAVAELMLQARVGAVAVVDRSGLVGICTDRDMTAAVAEGLALDSTVSLCMTPDPDVVDPDVPVVDAAKWMLEVGYRHLPVVEGNELLGIVDSRDVLWALVPTKDDD